MTMDAGNPTGVLNGHPEDLTGIHTNLVKIYVCSSYSDFKYERQCIWSEILPELQQYFLQYGLEVMLIDVHQGALNDHAYDRHLLDLHLQEMKASPHTSIGPFFLTLIGNRYGLVPLPSQLDEPEYTNIKEEVFEAGKDVKLLDEWYKYDGNAVPPVYKLQPITSQCKYYSTRNPTFTHQQESAVADWMLTFYTLQDMIQHGAQTAHAEGRMNQVHTHKQKRFFQSALEEESHAAKKDSKNKCLAIMRVFQDIDVHHVAAKEYTDVLAGTTTLDLEAQKKLKQLREEFAEQLNEDNIHSFCLQWQEKGLAPITNTDHNEYLDNFHAVVVTKLKKLIKKEYQNRPINNTSGKKCTSRDAIYSECTSHLAHFQRLSKLNVHGFDTLQEKTRTHIIKSLKGGEHQMLLFYGTEGCGKTTLMSKVAQIAIEILGKDTILAVRYLGLTRDSCTAHSVLYNFCCQISCSLKQDMDITAYSFEQLVSFYHGLLGLISKGTRNLVIIVDNLEVLMPSSQNGEYKLDWLTAKLSPKIHIFASFTTSSSAHAAMFGKVRSKLNSRDYLTEVSPLSEKSCVQIVLDSLTKNKLKVSVEVEKVIASTLKQTVLPLCVSVFLEHLLPSLRNPHPNVNGLPVSLEDGIHLKFSILDEKYGKPLIGQISRYLLASQDGLTELELLDLLSCNDGVINYCYPTTLPDIVRFPSSLWLQIEKDLGVFLDRKYVLGSLLLFWRHRCIANIAAARYFESNEDLKKSHSDIVDLFLETWVHNKALIVARGNENQIIEGVFRHVSEQPLLFSETMYNQRRLNESLHQLVHAGDIQRFKQHAVCNHEFLLSRLHSSSVQRLLNDLETTFKSVMDLELYLVLSIVRISMNTLTKDPLQLASEFIGRLRQIKEDFTPSTEHLADQYPNDIESLVQQCMQWCDSYTLPLLIPLTSWLPDPRTAQVTSLKSSEAIAVVQPTTNNQHIFCGTYKNSIQMYHIASQKMIKAFTGHRGTVTCLKIAKNNKTLVSGSTDSTVRIWDVASGKCTNIFKGHSDAVLCLCMTSDDDLIVSGSKDKTFQIHSISAGKQKHIVREHKAAVTCLTLNRTDSILVTGSADCTVRFWCMEDMTPLSTISGTESAITCLALSQDNTFLLLGCEDCSVHVKSFTTGSAIHRLQEHKAKPLCLSISSDCFHAVVGCHNGSMYIYNIRTTELLNMLTAHKAPVTALSISKDETFLFSCAKEELIVWTMYKYFTKKTHTDSHTELITCAAIAPDGKMAITGSKDKIVKLWNLEISDFLEDLIGHEGAITCVALANETAFAISGSEDKTVKIWSIMLGMVVTDYTEHKSCVTSVFIVSDRLQVLSAESAGVIKIWQAEDGVTLLSCSGPTNILGVAPSGDYAVSGDGDQNLKIWRVENGDLVHSINHVDTVTVVLFSPDSQYLITGSSDMSLKVWEGTTGKITQILVGHEAAVSCVAITDNNDLIVSGSHDKQLLVWRLETGEVQHKLIGHSDHVTTVKVLSDSNTAISGSRDGILRVWSMSKGEPITLFDTHYPVRDLYVTPDAGHIVVYLEYHHQVPLMCLHNSPASINKCTSEVSVHDSTTEPRMLPIKPRPPLVRKMSAIFPVPKKVRHVSRLSVSSIPEIIKVSPIKAPMQKTVKAQESNKEKKEGKLSKSGNESSNDHSAVKKNNAKSKKSGICVLV